MKLPEDFKNRMKHLLGESYSDFLLSFDAPQEKALQIHPRQTPLSVITENIPGLTPMKHLQLSAYYDGEKIGMHPYHHAGILYSQDPAAMLPAGLFPFPKDAKVLDVCAAPGGKSSQIAAFLEEGKGFLVANEIHPARNKILISNLERMGYKNVMVTKLEASQLSDTYPGFFDVVIVDAPCSGEGMFRKYPESCAEWSVQQVSQCADRQMEILSHACKCLRPGGSMIYSTCTYSIEENENIVYYLINREDLELLNIDIPKSISTWHLSQHKLTDSSSDSPFTNSSLPEDILRSSHRFYPHLGKGEGQFFCYLKKSGDFKLSSAADYREQLKAKGLRPVSAKNKAIIKESLSGQLSGIYDNIYEQDGRFYLIPYLPVPLPAFGITRLGLPMGEMQKNRFVPHHCLFHSYGHLFDNQISYHLSDDNIWAYLHGQEITDSRAANGYGTICIDNTPIGGFKASNGKLKNHYPKSLRNQQLYYT